MLPSSSTMFLSARHPSDTEGSSQVSTASVKTVVNDELAKIEE